MSSNTHSRYNILKKFRKNRSSDSSNHPVHLDSKVGEAAPEPANTNENDSTPHSLYALIDK